MFKHLKRKLKGKENILSNFISLLVLQGANFILPLIALPYLVRVLELHNFGLVMFAQAFIAYFTILVDYGFNLSATREISLNRNDESKLALIFSTVMLIKIILLIISFLLLTLIVFSFEKFYVNIELYYLSFGLVIGQMLFPVWFFQGIEKMKYITILNIIAKSIFTFFIFLFINNKNDYLFVPILNSMGFIVVGFISLYIILFKFNVKIIIPKFEYIKYIFKESTSLFISRLSVTLYSASNTLILGFLASESIVGIYSSIEKLVLAIKNLYIPLYQALFPWLSRHDINDVVKIIIKMVLPIFIFSSTVTVVLYIFSEDLLEIVFNQKLLTEHYLVFQIMSLISIFAALNMLFNMLYLTSIKAYKERMVIMLTSGLINIVVVFFLTYKYSLYGTAIGVTITEFLLLLFGVYYFFKFNKDILVR